MRSSARSPGPALSRRLSRRHWAALAGASWLACALGACPQLCAAQVIEPNGVKVPAPSSGGASETTLQAYFDALSPPEPIDAVADASPEPATFSPLCDFEAALVLSQSSAAAGLAWYNVPADPSAAPDAIYPIVAETTMTGATLSSSAIRDDPSYAGGLVGFVLTKLGGQPIYYSEYRRNALCSACSMPGHWKMMLAYASRLQPNTYYLAFEDWEGANENGWPDDGDFNDKVFELQGVRCAGGGEPCDTGMLGVCARGLTGCANGGTPACNPHVGAMPESCDGADNDCDGMIDEGQLCELSEICERGNCLPACYGGEFNCLAGATCVEGHCVEDACADVSCEPGLVCRAGACVSPCDGVVCPLGQACSGGVCRDPCEGVQCDQGLVCVSGVCVESCACAACPSGLSCNASSGQCMAPNCAGVSCEPGSVCNDGMCQDPCEGVKCPGGERCASGRCGEPATAGGGGAKAAGAGGVGTSATAGAAAGGTNGGQAGTQDMRAAGDGASAGCGCELARSRAAAAPGALAAYLLLAAWAWHARRRRGVR